MSADHHASNPDDLIIKRRNALLIRGSREIDQQLEELFDRDVWKLSYAHDNATALELATAEAFDLIVTSARTTGGEDVELLRRLRMVRPHTRLIILTEKKVNGDVLNALRYHAFSLQAPIRKRLCQWHACQDIVSLVTLGCDLVRCEGTGSRAASKSDVVVPASSAMNDAGDSVASPKYYEVPPLPLDRSCMAPSKCFLGTGSSASPAAGNTATHPVIFPRCSNRKDI